MDPFEQKLNSDAQPAGEQPNEGRTHDGASDEVDKAQRDGGIKYTPMGRPSREHSGHDFSTGGK